MTGIATLGAIGFDAATTLTISSGTIIINQGTHTIAAESGTADDLDTIQFVGIGGVAPNTMLLVLQADTGDTITIKHGTGNISLNGAADFELSGSKRLLLYYDSNGWSDVGAGGGGSGSNLSSGSTIGQTALWDGAAWYADTERYTPIRRQEFSTNLAAINFSAYPMNFSHLIIPFKTRSDAVAVSDPVEIRFNGSSTPANYYQQEYTIFGATVSATERMGVNGFVRAIGNGGSAPAAFLSSFELVIPGYSSSTQEKTIFIRGVIPTGTATGQIFAFNVFAIFRSTVPITSVSITPGGNNFTQGEYSLTLLG